MEFAVDTKAYADYQSKKQHIIASFQQKASSQGVGLHKDTSNLFRNRQLKQQRIDVRALNKVIHIDRDNLFADVEGMTTYEDLVHAALLQGCLPTVVPELKSITIGGALSGIGIESSSFRYGLVHETVLEFDVLLGDGRVVTCKPDNEYSDLFYAFPNSYGTLGYALRVRVKLIPAKPFIKLNHQHFSDPAQYYATMQELCERNRDKGDIAYIDGSVFSETEMYITTAEFVDQVPYTSNYKYMSIYYRSIQSRQTDYLTSIDYIWRWDPDWFWCSKVFYMQNPIMRFLFGKWMLKSTSYWKIKNLVNRNAVLRYLTEKLGKPTESVIQDVAIPIENAQQFFDFFHKEIGIKPFWNCPVFAYDDDAEFSLFKVKPNQLYVNFGFWDMIPTHKPDGYYNRLVENKVYELGGIKSLYSNVYFSKDEFWEIYDKTNYQFLKGQYDPDGALGDLYEKCVEKT